MKTNALLISICVIMFACAPDNTKNSFPKNNIVFPDSLSAFGLFKGSMNELVPADDIRVLELSSALFTDYTEKQRLLKLPPGTSMKANGDGLPDFPDGTVLAKTFFYTAAQTKAKQKIIETRLLQKHNGVWNVATYKWNDSQTDAFLTGNGGVVEITITKPDGERKQVNYKIPTVYECFDCHTSNNEAAPIGPKLRNLNRDILVGGKAASQLQLLHEEGLLALQNPGKIMRLPAYTDKDLPLEKRARAYFEINCAHCHNPGGFARGYSLDLRFEKGFDNTGILFNKWNIEHRMTIRDMPKLGTTVIDEEGLRLVQEYLKNLKK